MDLIRAGAIEPDLEYVFKHALTQEVDYNGLLKKEREEIYERVAFVMEDIFHDRITEFYETLTFHFSRSRSNVKAVEHLVRSLKKSLARYTVEKAHQYFKEAYDILTAKTEKSSDEEIALVDMLNDWGYVYYCLGNINIWIDLPTAHREQPESLEHKGRLGMFNVWLGVAYSMGGKSKIAYDYLSRALSFGEEAGDEKSSAMPKPFLHGYAKTWPFLMKLLDTVKGAQRIAKSFHLINTHTSNLWRRWDVNASGDELG